MGGNPAGLGSAPSLSDLFEGSMIEASGTGESQEAAGKELKWSRLSLKIPQ